METAIIVAVIALLGTVAASGAVTAITQSKLAKKEKKEAKEDRTEEQLKEIKESMSLLFQRTEEIDEKIDCNEAKRARTQILRFADEIYAGVKHTREHFDDMLDTIDDYNLYCREHPEFKNMRTVNAQEKIVQIYKKCDKEHSFLDSRKDQENEKQV